MALTESVHIPTIVLSGNPAVSRLLSDNSTTGSNVAAMHVLEMDQKAAVDETLTVSILNGAYELVFTAKVLPSNSGKQFPSGAGAVDASYAASVVLWLKKNYLLSVYYNVEYTYTSAWLLIFRAKEYGPEFNIEITQKFSGTLASLTAGTTPELRENFAVHGTLYVYEGGNWEKVVEDRVTADEDEYAEFDFSEAIDAYMKNLNDSELNMQYPDTFTYMKDQAALIRKFFFKYSEFFGVPYLPEYMTQNSGYFYAIEGGFSKKFLAYLNSEDGDFYEKLVQDHMFLTWQPLINYVHKDQIQRLWYLNIFNTTKINMNVKAYKTSGSTVTHTVYAVTGVAQYKMYEIIVSPVKLKADFTMGTGEDVIKYDIWLTDEAGDVISETRTIIVDRGIHEFIRYFLYKNSYGCFETIYTTGIGIKNTEYSRAEIERSNEYDFTNLEFSKKPVKTVETENMQVSTRYYESIDEIERLRDFLRSNEIYEIMNGTLMPVELTSTKATIREDGNYNYALEFEYRYSYDSEYFSVEEFSGFVPRSAVFDDGGEAEFSDAGSAIFER